MRRQVGAVIVKDNRIIATGYNAQPIGVSECCNKGYCVRQQYKGGEGLEECTVVHAEINAITQCAFKHHIQHLVVTYIVAPSQLVPNKAH